MNTRIISHIFFLSSSKDFHSVSQCLSSHLHFLYPHIRSPAVGPSRNLTNPDKPRAYKQWNTICEHFVCDMAEITSTDINYLSLLSLNCNNGRTCLRLRSRQDFNRCYYIAIKKDLLWKSFPVIIATTWRSSYAIFTINLRPDFIREMGIAMNWKYSGWNGIRSQGISGLAMPKTAWHHNFSLCHSAFTQVRSIGFDSNFNNASITSEMLVSIISLKLLVKSS